MLSGAEGSFHTKMTIHEPGTLIQMTVSAKDQVNSITFQDTDEVLPYFHQVAFFV